MLRCECPIVNRPAARRQRLRRQRNRAVLITLVCGIVTALGCLLINLFVGSPIEWIWLLAAPLWVTLLMGSFLWVRLTPSS